MGLLDQLLARHEPATTTIATRSLENPNVSLNDPRAWADLGWSTESISGVKVTPKKALGHAPVWAAVRLIARGVGKLRPYVYKRLPNDNQERDKNHPAYNLLRRKANKWVNARTFRETMTYHAVFYGNAYALILRDNRGRLVPLNQGGGLIILSPTETLPIQVRGELVYRTIANGEEVFFPASDVIHVKGLSDDGLVGRSVIEVLANALGVGIAARDYAARFFANGANASGILMLPEGMKSGAMENAVKAFEKFATGSKNQHKVGLLQANVRWQPFSHNAQESQLLDVQQFDLLTVSNVFGIQPHKLGSDSTTSYNSLEQQNQSFHDEALDPWLSSFEEEFEDKLLTDAERDSDSHYIEFSRDALLRADLMTRYNAYQKGIMGGWLTPNQVCHKENLPSIGPAGDHNYIPGNLRRIDQEPDEPLDPDQTPAPDEDQFRAETVETFVDRLDPLFKVEAKAIRRAAINKPNFLAFVDEFYGEQRARLEEALQPQLRLWSAFTGRSVVGVAEDIAQRLVDRSREELLRITGQVTAKALPAAVAAFNGGTDEDELRQIITDVLGAA